MTLSVRLSVNDENLLEKVARQLGRSKSDLARQAVHELCQKLAQAERTPYSMGVDLFDVGKLAKPPSDPLKREIWEKLHAKHHDMG